ncbi:hypothetical protein CWI39_0117p0010 [Hamiltosporidium magnivora]|uniref:Uncharacterized protein n=1 Tax=Hamiltosporidium magnivora TaxID=148818 RepID=A0A4Q9LNE9_9MICR|nr:hypothetical protein CWI39_0117p0010 [Hamiltosporidium magnivora]
MGRNSNLHLDKTSTRTSDLCAECTDKTRCTSKKQTERNNELNTTEVSRTIQDVKPRVQGRDLGDTPHEQTDRNKDTSSTKDHNANVINEMTDASDNKNTNSDTTTLYETTQITHINNTLTSSRNKTTGKILSRLRVRVHICTVPKQNTLGGGTDVAKQQKTLITQEKSPFTNARHVLLYFGDITSKKISLYPLALKNIQPGASKLVVNIKFISNTVLEMICKESVQIEVIKGFRMLGAKNFINSPEVDSNGLFKISKRDRYSNKEGIIVFGRDTIDSEAIKNITDEGVSIKVNEQIFIFIYRSLKNYNLEQHKTLLQQILDNHAMYRLSGIDILTNTYKHNNKESKPDKIFTNTIVDIKISPISSNFNPVFQHIRRARERTRNNIKFLYERLYKEVKRLTKNLPDTDTRDLKVEHIGLEASQLEAIMNFHGNGIPNNRQNNNKELLNNFVLDRKIASLEEQ